MATIAPENRIGALLREWREQRRLSQLDLSLEAEVSTRHLSFLETGRSTPSQEMVLHLAERLEVPLRERNRYWSPPATRRSNERRRWRPRRCPTS